MHKVNMGWIHGVVKPYFASKGIVLLRDDILFIEKCLNRIPSDRHKSVMRGFYSVWYAKVLESKESGLEVINARFEANVYLRNLAGLNVKHQPAR